MNLALQRRRDYTGPALFSYGFRPFFLSAGAWAVLSILLWVPQYLALYVPPMRFVPLDWHIHEMLFGYVAAAIAGFLLTAIPNWTGRLPINGIPLALLWCVWLAGRLAIATAAWIGEIPAAIIDVAFLALLGFFAAREIMAGKNWRNLRVLVVIGLLIAGNIVFHIEVMRTGAADYGVRISIGAVILLISLVGGRIVPSFTNNWLARTNPGRLPVPFGRFDIACMLGGAVALLAWIVAPQWAGTGALLLLAGALHAVRLARWAGERTFADRLVLVLHVGYAFVPLGFILLGLAYFTGWPPSAGIHAWTAGAIAIMTLAVMTRATLGHTGSPLRANVATQLVYVTAFAAALVRIAAALLYSLPLIELAALLWVLAFGGYVAVYGPLLLRQRPAWQEPSR
jgi:uncharacterized protein involved in response to NO